MSNSVTHVAGPAVGFRDLKRVIQRCAVCGEKLADNLNVMMPLNPDGTPPIFPTWEDGALIQIEGNRTSVVGSFFDKEKPLPDDFCLSLVED